MRFRDIRSALFGLYNLAMTSPSKGTDYQRAFDVRYTALDTTKIPHEDIIKSRRLITQIEKLCNSDDERAFLAFYFGYQDKFGDYKQLNYLATQLCQSVPAGQIFLWHHRDKVDNAAYKLAAILNVGKRSAEYKITATKKLIDSWYLRFTDNDYKLASLIENLLISEGVLIYPNENYD